MHRSFNFILRWLCFPTALVFAQACNTKPDLVWTMVDVNDTHLQGDAHLIEVRNGKTVLIDAGHLEPAQRKLIPLLKEKGLHTIDLVFISHPHRDHYEGLRPLLNAGIRMGTVYFNLPDKSLCDRESPWGCDYQQVLEYRQMLNAADVKVNELKAGMSFDLGRQAVIDVLYVFDGIDTPVGKTDVNDMSAIMLLQSRDTRILFPGDVNRAIGGYLAEHGRNLNADLLKVPHHGAKGIAPNQFFERVNPKAALVPAPKWLWCDPRSDQVRQWVLEKDIPVWINGFHGHIAVAVFKNSFIITPEIQATTDCPP